MEPKNPNNSGEELNEPIDDEGSDDHAEESQDGYQKFIAEMVLLGNLNEKLAEGGFSFFPKFSLKPTEQSQKQITGNTTETGQAPSKSESQDQQILKSLAQNINRIGEFNIQSFLDVRRDNSASRLSIELRDYELDIDFGTHEFQRRFYAKYILVNSSKYKSEKEKAENLKIKVIVSDKDILSLTRSRMDSLLSDFKRAYVSYCKLRSLLSPICIQTFDSILHFFDYALLQEVASETYELRENERDFEIRWLRGKVWLADRQGADFTDPSFFKDLLFAYFKREALDSLRTLTDQPSLRDERIIAHYERENHALFEYLLKFEKQNMESKQHAKEHQ